MKSSLGCVCLLLASISSFAAPARPDFNGDLHADIAWFKPDGSLGIWDMNGLSRIDYGALPSSPGTTMAFTGDIDGDGKSDVVARRPDGGYTIYFMDGAAGKSTYDIAANGWAIAAVADFNADGKADLLWVDNFGNLGVWLMDGASVIDYAALDSPYPSYNSQLLAVADFDGDGRSDLLVRYGGYVQLLLMDGLQAKTSAQLRDNSTVAGGQWWPVLTGDFDGDGKADIVWEDNFGAYGLWLMDGTTVKSTTTVLAAGGHWRAVMTADLDGDGKDDIIWHNDMDGSYGAWIMNGAAASAYGVLLYGGSSWELVDGRDLDGDGKTDLLWHNTYDNTYGAWIMNGLAPSSYGALLYPAPGDGSNHWTPLPVKGAFLGVTCTPSGC